MSWNLERQGNVVVARIEGTKANAQNEAFFTDLDEAFERLEGEFSDCAVVLTAEGSTFSAGLDFEEAFAALASTDPKQLADWVRRYEETNLRIWRHPRPTVAAINGHAFAGGLITALDCDYRVTVEGARFSLNEVPIGIAMPAIYVEIIRHAVGTPVASVATLFGHEFDTDEALRVGFVHAVTSRRSAAARRDRRRRADLARRLRRLRVLQAGAPGARRRAGRDVAARLDKDLPRVLASDAAVRLRALRYSQIKGDRPDWARES